tara:strand:+ start:635 stop:1330 length:696 start_codon:yes stop_codon:yes gene_type:complete
MINITTQYPNATHSPDFIFPIGAIQDNHSNSVYLSELSRVTGKEKFAYLDLGCAGGQTVVDVYNNGNIACGVEGSDLEKMISISKNRTRPTPRFIGAMDVPDSDIHDNWTEFKDKCLFKADITKPFELSNDRGIQKFDIITAWDVLEHPTPEQIPAVIDNIKRHLKDDGVFVCLINLVPSPHHQCVKPKEWWVDVFNKNGLEDRGFDFNASPRHTHQPLDSNDLGFMLELK